MNHYWIDLFEAAQPWLLAALAHLAHPLAVVELFATACGWKKQHDRPLYIDHGNTGIPFKLIGVSQAVALVDGMRFVCIPPATY